VLAVYYYDYLQIPLNSWEPNMCMTPDTHRCLDVWPYGNWIQWSIIHTN